MNKISHKRKLTINLIHTKSQSSKNTTTPILMRTTLGRAPNQGLKLAKPFAIISIYNAPIIFLDGQ